MPIREMPFGKVEELLRRKKFGFLSTANRQGVPHSAGVIYVASTPQTKFCLYVMTGAQVKKTRNIRENPRVAFGIPFTHHLLRPAPDFAIQFQGIAEILPKDDPNATTAFQQNPMLQRMLEKQGPTSREDVFLKITPQRKIHGFGLGLGLFKLLKNIENGQFVSLIPEDRL